MRCLLDLRWLQIAFVVMLIGTFIETGSGMIHAVNERVAGALKAVGKDLSNKNRAAVGVWKVMGRGESVSL